MARLNPRYLTLISFILHASTKQHALLKTVFSIYPFKPKSMVIETYFFYAINSSQNSNIQEKNALF